MYTNKMNILIFTLLAFTVAQMPLLPPLPPMGGSLPPLPGSSSLPSLPGSGSLPGLPGASGSSGVPQLCSLVTPADVTPAQQAHLYEICHCDLDIGTGDIPDNINSRACMLQNTATSVKFGIPYCDLLSSRKNCPDIRNGSCPEHATKVNGKCQCTTTNANPVNGTCAAPVTCRPNEVKINDTCKPRCNANQVRDSTTGNCKNMCTAPMEFYKVGCVKTCPTGQHVENDNCVPDPTYCMNSKDDCSAFWNPILAERRSHLAMALQELNHRRRNRRLQAIVPRRNVQAHRNSAAAAHAL